MSGDEVHLWWGKLDRVHSLDVGRGWLSEEERRRCERFHRDEDAFAFAARRVFLRSVLARYVDARPAELAFATGAHGKPELCGGGDLRFNASRSGRWALVGVARGREIGVDVERGATWLADGEELSRLAERVLSTREKVEWAHIEPAQRVAAFLRLWARKEALLKALGTGFSREPDTVEVGLAGQACATLDDPAFSGQATMVDVAAPADAAACVAVTGTGLRIVAARGHRSVTASSG